jgi:transcriptional regulator with XRE-family HTH domain
MAPMATHAASIEFAALLREWRERRRVSQLELALRAGTTQRHVSFVERGRSLPGRGMVVRLAEALEVPLRGRNELLLAAGYAPVYAQTQLDDPILDPVRGALEQVLEGHLPYPAVLTDRTGDLVSGNDAFMTLLDGVPHSLRQPRLNVARVLVHPDGLGSRVLNMNEWGRHVINGLARKAQRDPNAGLERLVAELEGYVPSPRHEAPTQHLGFAVPLRLRMDDGELTLLTTLAHFATAVDVTLSELTLEAFLPADAATASHFQATAGRSGPGAGS